jgi:hypothetical protein
MTDANPFDDFVVEYYDDPVRFVREVLGADPLPYQAEFLAAIGAWHRQVDVCQLGDAVVFVSALSE